MNSPGSYPSDPSIPSSDRLVELLGIEPISWGEGRSELALTVDDRHLRNLPILHGGVTATLLDSALGVAANTVAPTDRLTVTAQLNINFIRPAFPGERLLATGQVRHSGRQSVVVTGEVRCKSGELVATASGTFLFTDVPDVPDVPDTADDSNASETPAGHPAASDEDPA
jgi:uncharacterized protein (TIGR00369 family)